MKNLKLLVLAGIVIMFLASCSSVSVTTDFDKTVDFTKYKTFEYYGWADESDKILNDFERKRIEQAFGDEFAKRGIKNVENDGDLVVTLFIVVKQKTEQRATTTGSGGMYGGYGGYYGGYYGYGPGWGWGSSYSTTTVTQHDYNVGTLVVDVFDKAEERLIWESIGQGTVDDDPQSREHNTPKTVAKIMKDYPVQPIESK
jgi:hypothetical protein